MITGFQFKASMYALKLNAKEASNLVCLSQATLLRFGKVQNFDYINCHTSTNIALINFFEKEGIVLHTQNSISLAYKENNQIPDNAITRFQLVCARIATGLNQKELSHHLRISAGTISLLESLDNHEIIQTRTIHISTLKKFFERIGVIFNDQCTVTLKKDPSIFFKKRTNVH